MKSFLYLALLLFSTTLLAQTAQIKGIILDESKTPIPSVNVSYLDGGTLTNENGFYNLAIPANKNITVTISYVGFKKVVFTVNLQSHSFLVEKIY